MHTHWWQLTDWEADNLNPPSDIELVMQGDDIERMVRYQQDWLPMGHVQIPRTRLGWFVYHVAHGLLMRYPLHKVVGFALANNKLESEWETISGDELVARSRRRDEASITERDSR